MKDDSISRQAAIDAAHKNYDTILDFKSDGRTVADSFEDIINVLPSAQPERKRGRWEMKPDPYGFFDKVPVCSECGCIPKWREKYPYCPYCGADMRGEDE